MEAFLKISVGFLFGMLFTMFIDDNFIVVHFLSLVK